MNLGRELRTIKIAEEPETLPEPVEEPRWPEADDQPVPV
jgi:hypothetical protein